MSENSIFPVILCGGRGSRLWPLSRETYPKQFLNLNSNNNKSLLQETILRTKSIKNIKNPIFICNEEHRFIVAEQLRSIKIKPHSILLEPFGRNTAPAILISALIALEKEDDPNLLILSSDHEIKNENHFLDIINEGLKYSEKNRLVTFGVIPTSAETGYGYIEANQKFDDEFIKGVDIKRFVEKPDQETANQYIKDKRFTWNSGIFLFKAKMIISEIKKLSPLVYKSCSKAFSKNLKDLDFTRIDKDSFAKCPNISIDVAVMEKTKLGTVLPFKAGWSDIGSWKTVWETSKKDENGNFLKGNVISKDVKNCYLRSEDRLIVGIGINNLSIVETQDAVLIADLRQSQKVKNVVEELKAKGISEGQEHLKIYRPWGHYLSVSKEKSWQVKLICVKPGEKLSLQMHHHRSEHWVVVKGTAKVLLNSKEIILSVNESTYIPIGAKHRLSNPGKIPLQIIEIQSGTYLGEDDIVRFEDNYGRT
ncbi:MAG: mannose-1-phosphate guanylyltransferase/mannose-6-phosphate isomerase [Prochlorococcus marinus XMU1422]|nr:mannose-1-phosphate guanylyltransferase/mannose-6-phosphate isomerase [Prochlorococcus marinus XMU1421]MBO7013238.1 mannose-1-phosphate guanylyltransferase/mannose-6-phosphate isomerase [Prochlorococcus marinus XMU1422]MCR8542307.1 mannose-1-phosphate guanylyltransferase/mannose-6-phosphate isomerase [Prochlorococcus marinus XMU1423]